MRIEPTRPMENLATALIHEPVSYITREDVSKEV